MPTTYLKRLYFDSLVYTHHQLHYLVEQYGADHILVGTDYPADMGEIDPVGFIEGARAWTTRHGARSWAATQRGCWASRCRRDSGRYGEARAGDVRYARSAAVGLRDCSRPKSGARDPINQSLKPTFNQVQPRSLHPPPGRYFAEASPDPSYSDQRRSRFP